MDEAEARSGGHVQRRGAAVVADVQVLVGACVEERRHGATAHPRRHMQWRVATVVGGVKVPARVEQRVQPRCRLRSRVVYGRAAAVVDGVDACARQEERFQHPVYRNRLDGVVLRRTEAAVDDAEVFPDLIEGGHHRYAAAGDSHMQGCLARHVARVNGCPLVE